MIVRNQHIMGFGGAVDINFTSVEFAMELYKIKNRRDCFERILILYHRALETSRAKQEAN